MYDPTIGRWLSEDPIGFEAGDANLYRYVGNGPANATDPSGLVPGQDDSGNGEPEYVESSGGWWSGIPLIGPFVDFISSDIGAQADKNRAEKIDLYNALCDFEDVEVSLQTGNNLGEVKGAIESLPRLYGDFAIAASGAAGASWASKGLPPGFDPAKGFKSFNDLKKAFGSAGPGHAWHHVVEQTINSGKFAPQLLHNPGSLFRLPHGKGTIHSKISGLYSSKQPYTGGLTVRQWLSKKSFREQFEFGIQIIKDFGGSQYLPPFLR
jgi:hypothetical protein